MILTQRKSKYKHKVTVRREEGKANKNPDMISWCEQTFGRGGRRERWRFGWIDSDSTFYFKNGKDAMLFTLRWSN
jgi:hypothetical protein